MAPGNPCCSLAWGCIPPGSASTFPLCLSECLFSSLRTSVILDVGLTLITYDLILMCYIYKNPISQQRSEVPSGWEFGGTLLTRLQWPALLDTDSCNRKWEPRSWLTSRFLSQVEQKLWVDIGAALPRPPVLLTHCGCLCFYLPTPSSLQRLAIGSLERFV